MEITYIPSLALQEGERRAGQASHRGGESARELQSPCAAASPALSQHFSKDMSPPDLWRGSCLPPETPAHLAEAGIFSVSDTYTEARSRNVAEETSVEVLVCSFLEPDSQAGHPHGFESQTHL